MVLRGVGVHRLERTNQWELNGRELLDGTELLGIPCFCHHHVDAPSLRHGLVQLGEDGVQTTEYLLSTGCGVPIVVCPEH